MRISHAQKFKVLFPIRPFLRKRRRTKANFDPRHCPVFVQPRGLHIVEIFIASD
jgi:hypothetical protein